MLVQHDQSICNYKSMCTTHYWCVKMMDTGRFVTTNECVILNKVFQCMLFINNINVIIFYPDFFFSYHIKLDKVCDYELYLGYVNLLLNIMVSFNLPMTLIRILVWTKFPVQIIENHTYDYHAYVRRLFFYFVLYFLLPLRSDST